MPTWWRVGGFRWRSDTGELRTDRGPVALEPQPAALLKHLIECRERLVTREELRRMLWPEGTFVDFDAGLNYAVRHLRAALGDSARRPRYIETLPRRGYRFIAPVLPEVDVVCPGTPEWTVHARSHRRRTAARVGALAATAVLVLLLGLGRVAPREAPPRGAIRMAVVATATFIHDVVLGLDDRSVHHRRAVAVGRACLDSLLP